MTDLPAIVPAAQPFVEGAAEEAKKLIVEYRLQEAYLKEELTAAIKEIEFQARWLRIKLWWNLGRIIIDWQKAASRKLGRTQPLEDFCNAVTARAGLGKESGYKMVQIRKQFPTEESLKELPFGKAVSVHLIVNKVLPGLSAGKTMQEIAQEDAKDVAARQANQPTLLYDGPAELNEYSDHWSVDLPTGVGVRAWGGTPVLVKIWEAE